MELYFIATTLIVLSAIFGYINVRFFKLPTSIGLMIIAIVFTLGIIISSFIDETLYVGAKAMMEQIDFSTVLLDIMLGFLLFAGALHTNFEQLKINRGPILIFATLGVLSSTFIVGGITFYLMPLLGLEVEFIHCLLFGALISPTDPIAVMGILSKAGVPKRLEAMIVGESLFNDGIGVVIFLTILNIAEGGSANAHAGSGIMDIAQLLSQEVIGGLIVGGILGYITYLLLQSIDDYDIEILITVACVMGGYSLGHFLHVSAPLSMVVAGLIVGNETSRDNTMSKITEQYLDKFWELIDLMLNAVLFVLIGLEILLIQFRMPFIYAGLISIVVVLLSRYLSLIIPVRFFNKKLDFVPHTAKIMVWGGLRGGISIALALSLSSAMSRDLFISITYLVVCFSIIVQGLTIERLAGRLIGKHAGNINKDLTHE